MVLTEVVYVGPGSRLWICSCGAESGPGEEAAIFAEANEHYDWHRRQPVTVENPR